MMNGGQSDRRTVGQQQLRLRVYSGVGNTRDSVGVRFLDLSPRPPIRPSPGSPRSA
jgi:hypothetical protein